MQSENKNKRKLPDDFTAVDHREEKKSCLTVNHQDVHNGIPQEIINLFGKDHLAELSKKMMDFLQKNYQQTFHKKGYFGFEEEELSVNKLEVHPTEGMLRDIYEKLIKYLFGKHLAVFLTNHPQINRLSIDRSTINFFGIDHAEEILRLLLSACPDIKELSLDAMSGVYGRIITEALARINDCWPIGLIKLSMQGSNLIDRDIKRIATIATLQELDLSENRILNSGANIVSRMPNIKKLVLDDCGIDLKGIESLLSNSDIEYLDLKNNTMSIHEVTAIAKAIKANQHRELEIHFGGIFIGLTIGNQHWEAEPLVNAMKKNTIVMLYGLRDEEINLMNERNILLKKYPEFASYIKGAFGEHGLYEYQFNAFQPRSIKNCNIYNEIRRRDVSGESERMRALSIDIEKLIPRLEALSAEKSLPAEEVTYHESYNRWFV